MKKEVRPYVTKNTKVVTVIAIVAAIILVGGFLGRDYVLRPKGTHDCGDGPRPTIDTRNFTHSIRLTLWNWKEV